MCYPASHGDRRSCTCSPSCTGRSIWCGSPTGLWSVFSNNGCQREDLRLCRSQDFHGKAEIKKIRIFLVWCTYKVIFSFCYNKNNIFSMCFCMPSSGNTQKWTIMQGYFQFVSLLLYYVTQTYHKHPRVCSLSSLFFANGKLFIFLKTFIHPLFCCSGSDSIDLCILNCENCMKRSNPSLEQQLYNNIFDKLFLK